VVVDNEGYFCFCDVVSIGDDEESAKVSFNLNGWLWLSKCEGTSFGVTLREQDIDVAQSRIRNDGDLLKVYFPSISIQGTERNIGTRVEQEYDRYAEARHIRCEIDPADIP